MSPHRRAFNARTDSLQDETDLPQWNMTVSPKPARFVEQPDGNGRNRDRSGQSIVKGESLPRSS